MDIWPWIVCSSLTELRNTKRGRETLLRGARALALHAAANRRRSLNHSLHTCLNSALYGSRVCAFAAADRLRLLIPCVHGARLSCEHDALQQPKRAPWGAGAHLALILRRADHGGLDANSCGEHNLAQLRPTCLARSDRPFDQCGDQVAVTRSYHDHRLLCRKALQHPPDASCGLHRTGGTARHPSIRLDRRGPHEQRGGGHVRAIREAYRKPRDAAVRSSVFVLAASRVRIGLAERRGRVGAWCVCSAASERARERERERRASLFCLAAAASSAACRSSSRGLFGEDSGERRGVCELWWGCVFGLCTGAFCRVRGTRALRARAP